VQKNNTMVNPMKPNLGGVKQKAPGSPVYEFLKKEDLTNALRDALVISFREITAQINYLIFLYTKTAVFSPWTWGFTSRWGYDFWAKQN